MAWIDFDCDYCKTSCSYDEELGPWHYAKYGVCSRECYMARRAEEAMNRLVHALETPARLASLKHDLGLL